MPKLSPSRLKVPVLTGLESPHRGKVRDSYPLDEEHMLVVTTDAVSIFDFVLDALVPQKGAILNAMSHFWLTKMQELNIATHMVAFGAGIDPYLPEHLRGNVDLQSRAMVVKRLKMVKREFIARGFLTGSGLEAYKKTGEVCGHKLSADLEDGDVIEPAIDTPSTKADVGHDEHLDAATIRAECPNETALLLAIYKLGRKVATGAGILIADTKLEFGYDSSGQLCLGDEVLTPDSSRFWEYPAWHNSRQLDVRKAPPPYDKQAVRQWGITQGVNKLKPEVDADVAHVHSLTVPLELIEETTAIYRYIFWRLTGQTLEAYQREKMWINVEEKKRNLVILFGSDNDIPKVQSTLNALRGNSYATAFSNVAVHVISCHWNPKDLALLTAGGFDCADVVIAAGGKAFALPGVVDAQLYAHGYRIPVVGVALGTGSSLEAARLSIAELPGEPVVMDEVSDRVYEGDAGLLAAVHRAACGEFPPPKVREAKRPRFNIKY